MAVDESYNFDNNTFQGWSAFSGSNSTVEVSATAALDSSDYGVSFSWETQNSDDIGMSKSLADGYQDIEVSFYFIFNALGQFVADFRILHVCETSIYNKQGYLYCENRFGGSSYTLETSPGDETVSLSCDTEYLIRARYVRDSTEGGWQVWVDGTLEIDDLTHDTSGDDIEFLVMGGEIGSGNARQDSYIYIDEIQIGTDLGAAAGPIFLHHYKMAGGL